MKKIIVGLAAAVLLPLSASLQAKTICINTFNSTSQLKIVMKSIKKPGQFSAITGIYRENNLVAPISGAASVEADGTITIGFKWHLMGRAEQGRGIDFGGSGLSQSLVGTYFYGSGDDFESKEPVQASAFNCKDFTLTYNP